MNLDDSPGKVTVGHSKVDCRLRNEGFCEREKGGERERALGLFLSLTMTKK